ncbi:MAG TPA: FliM/FliN family flagellar motor switch protein [Verrucomicrobiae bacterium]|jgi:flagellar motor switch protein FliM|nr:FliM/FliN family flagellar motor switch protein [Verrucomicrobiae bacterium]
MEKVLNQAEIDAMIRAARAVDHGDPASSAAKQAEPWDVRRAGQIGREQLQAITLLHEGFARNLTRSLGAYLRVGFTAALVSAEHLTYREFLQRIPEITYLASCRLEPMGISAALQLDLKVAFPIIDLLLGGEGKGEVTSRQITEIEAQILDSVARIICRELGSAWQALSLEVNFGERLESGEALRLMVPEEKTLSLSFEIAVQELRGGLNLAVPSSISTALLRKISAEWGQHRGRPSDWKPRLMELLLNCPFSAELGASGSAVPLHELADLAPGKVLRLEREASEPASLLIAGQDAFRALVARRDRARAAKILERVPQALHTEDRSSEDQGVPPAKERSV